MKSARALFIGLLLAGQLSPALATGDISCRRDGATPPDRPRIGLALGGGGARGVAHISVLRVLEEMRVPVDCIAGTSMGALVGALYASGKSVDEIESVVLGLQWNELFNDSLTRPERSFRRKRDVELNITTVGAGINAKGVQVAPGVLAGENILLMFQRLTQPVATITDFDRLPIPYRAVAADLNSGAPVILGDGSLARAMRASMSIPGAFPPMEIDGKVLIDGGVARNVPVDVVRQMGADIIIAVDVGTPLAKLGANAGVLSIAGQLTGLMTVGNTREQLATLTERDVLISPPLQDKVATGDFSKGPEALAIGLEGVNAVRGQLARYSLSDDQFAAQVATRVGHSSEPPVIEFVRLDNRTGYSDEILLSRLDLPLGQPLDIDQLERELRAIYGFETMALVSYDLIHEDGKTGVLVHANQKVQGPNYVEAGLSLSSDFAGEFDAALRVGMLLSPINSAGGEVRAFAQIGNEAGLLGEYYQPFGASQRYFFFTRGQYLDRTLNQFNSAGDKLASYSGGEFRIIGAVGREFGNYGAALVGLRRATGTANVLVGDPDLPDFDYDSGEAFVQLTVDRLDSFYFPRKGYFARADYNYSRESLGADSEFEQFNFDMLGALPFGRHAVQAGLRYHATVAGVAPVQSLYRLGGFSRLSGYLPNELNGQNYAVLLGGYLYQLGSVIDRGAYFGVTAEYGNAWQQRSDMAFDDGIWNGSVYLGFDSWLGPALFGYGLRQGGEGNIFLQIGKAF